jgi:hypothetical protein
MSKGVSKGIEPNVSS